MSVEHDIEEYLMRFGEVRERLNRRLHPKYRVLADESEEEPVDNNDIAIYKHKFVYSRLRPVRFFQWIFQKLSYHRVNGKSVGFFKKTFYNVYNLLVRIEFQSFIRIKDKLLRKNITKGK